MARVRLVERACTIESVEAEFSYIMLQAHKSEHGRVEPLISDVVCSSSVRLGFLSFFSLSRELATMVSKKDRRDGRLGGGGG